MCIQNTLNGNLSLVKSWGGLSNNLGGYKVQEYKSLDEVNVEIGKVDKQRKYKGYKNITDDEKTIVG